MGQTVKKATQKGCGVSIPGSSKPLAEYHSLSLVLKEEAGCRPSTVKNSQNNWTCQFLCTRDFPDFRKIYCLLTQWTNAFELGEML